jgi:tetratricopeptide (TPR) repeat protein
VKHRAICLFLVLLFARLAAGADLVSVREEKLIMPTWEIGPPAVHSLFTNPKGPIYPYTFNEILTDRKVDKAYNAVFLENEYIQVLVLPEIGGRIHGALDKTNDYVWLYWQRTIKPGLISMTGAWISGGIEWNFPHGHRPSCFMPVDHRIVEHDDGSATVWVGETEPVYRMRWLVGVTVFPGKSYVRCDYVFINPTNHRHPFQFWATAATHANEYAQAQYPGDMVTGHGKHEFWNWPVHEGVDLTWWKNSPNASSYFAFNNPSDWFGTYDHRAQAGMVHVADHNVMPGKKLWTWGSGPSGRIWEDILTEGGGPYFEPQAGAWSDNQPDYHWMAPHEVKIAHDYWYPVRETRGYHEANRDFAINTDLKDGKAFAGVYSTGVAGLHRVVLTNTSTKEVLIDETADLAPDRPYAKEVPVSGDLTVYDLHLSVLDGKGNPRIELQRHRPREVELPPGEKDPGDPKQMNSDELYHAAEWLDRFVRTEKALEYYQEALRRDPGDSRVNTEMGFLELKQGRWEKALEYLETALQRDYDNSRIYYGKGLALQGLKRHREAWGQFYRATYTPDHFAVAHFNLAKIALLERDYPRAIEHASEAERLNRHFADIPALKAAAHRLSGQREKALAEAERALLLDPMHFMGGYEKLLALKEDTGEWEGMWQSIMRGAVQNYLELATAYAQSGLWEEADAVLLLAAAGEDDSRLYPMVNYLRGHFQELQGKADVAEQFYKRATHGPVRYTNPHRLEEKAALEAALSRNPGDAHAHLFLGNLLYALGQREEGLGHWRKSVESDSSLSLAWRNIAYAEATFRKDLQESYRAYQKTVELDPTDARALLELHGVAEDLKIPAGQRLAHLEQRIEVVKERDDLVARLVDLRLEQGGRENLESAYQALKTRHFHTWEGSYGIHHSWVEVNQKLGDLAFADKDYDRALSHYQEAREYPKNLEVAPRTPDFSAHVNWNLARLHLARNETERARGYIDQILSEQYGKPHVGTYYQALAHKALKNDGAYKSLLAGLTSAAKEYVSGKYEYRGNPEIIGHYLLSLVYEEAGDQRNAETALAKALSLNPQARRLAIREAQLDIARAHQ